jgi:hypothetical protein
VEILQLPALRSILSGGHPATELSQFVLGSSLYSLGGGPSRKHWFQQFFYYYYYYYYGLLPSERSDIVDLFTDRYQATHVPSRDRRIATVLHATLRFKMDT